MSFWFQTPGLQAINAGLGRTLVAHLGIECTEIGADFLRATMPVDHRTLQPDGLLHGGASAALAETLGSVAAGLVVDQSKYSCVGLDINANHVRAVRNGIVTGTARALHVGRTTQVWQILICDEADRLISVSRMTIAVLERRGKSTA